MKNIALIGMMGSGKTTVAEVISQITPLQLIDLDAKIESHERSTVAEIFARHGEEYFRDIESELLQKYAVQKNIILATGGGAILAEKNRQILLNNFFVVYLQTTPQVIKARLNQEISTRPLLPYEDTLKTIEHLLQSRRSFYEQAQMMITTDHLSLQEVAEQIIKCVEPYEHNTC